jgi:proline dehydrogenase
MPLRRTLLYLARQPGLRRWVENSAATRRLSRRFIAGSSLEDAVAACRRLKAEGISATLDYLGENVTSLAQAGVSRDMALRTLRALHSSQLEPNISLKLTQFGLDLSDDACEANVASVVEAAAAIGGFVRVDMESSAYTERTLKIVRHLYARYKACGTVIQAYLRRSAGDINDLALARTRVRLCKGAYLEDSDVAFEHKEDVDRNYLRLAEVLLQQGHYPALATHDERIIEEIRRFVTKHNIETDRFEFQMLFGIRRDLQRSLVEAGFRVRVYVPFGEAWYPYFMRRLAERPANLLFILRNIFRD